MKCGPNPLSVVNTEKKKIPDQLSDRSTKNRPDAKALGYPLINEL